MDYKNSILEQVGNTPLIKLNRLSKGLKPQIFAKLESANPGGSVKDRIGYNMIANAEKRGELKPGGTVIITSSISSISKSPSITSVMVLIISFQ